MSRTWSQVWLVVALFIDSSVFLGNGGTMITNFTGLRHTFSHLPQQHTDITQATQDRVPDSLVQRAFTQLNTYLQQHETQLVTLPQNSLKHKHGPISITLSPNPTTSPNPIWGLVTRCCIEQAVLPDVTCQWVRR